MHYVQTAAKKLLTIKTTLKHQEELLLKCKHQNPLSPHEEKNPNPYITFDMV